MKNLSLKFLIIIFLVGDDPGSLRTPTALANPATPTPISQPTPTDVPVPADTPTDAAPAEAAAVMPTSSPWITTTSLSRSMLATPSCCS